MKQSVEGDESGWKCRPGLGTQLLLVVGALSLVPLLISIATGYLSSRSDIEELSIQTLKKSARATALQGDVFIEEKQKIVPSLVAGNRHLQSETSRVLARLRDGEQVAEATALQEHLAAKAARAEHVAEYYVLSTDGVLLGSSRSSIDVGHRRPDTCFEHRDRAEPPNPYTEFADGEPSYLVSYPIADDTGETMALFCARFEFDIGDRLPRWNNSDLEGAVFHLLDDQGRLLWSSNPGQPREMDGTGLIEELGQDREWQGVHQCRQEGPKLMAINAMEKSPWAVVAEIPEQQALASLLTLRRRATVIAGGFGVLVLLGMFIAVGRLVRPLRQLVEATEQMRAGELSQSVEIGGPAEIARLGEVFNEMSREVSSLHQNLEKRVARRTEELEQKQQFIELIFDSMEDNLIVIDEDFNILKANRAARQTYGCSLRGSHCYAEMMGRENICENCPLPEALKQQGTFEGEQVHYCGEEAEIIAFRGFPLPAGSDDEPRKILLVSRIVTDDKQQERQMAHNEKMAAFALLAAGTAHEIGNPLASIKTQVDLAKNCDDEEFVAETLDVVSEQVRRTERLLRDMTDFARRRTGRRARVDVNRVVEDTIRLLTHDPRTKNVHLHTDLSCDLPAVYVDEDQLLQVLLNLGINGIDAAGEGGLVIMETFRRDEQVAIRVTDDGPPISAQITGRIFEPYFTTKSKGEGTGLGLFVSRRLVEAMEGTLKLERNCPQTGTSFTITLPKAGDSDATDTGG